MTSTHRLSRTVLALAIGAACVPNVIVRGAQTKDSRPVGAGQCKPVDPTFAQMAEATGGQVFMSNPSDMASAPVVADASFAVADRQATLLLSISGGAGVQASPQSFAVDESIRRLVVTGTFEGTGGTLDVLAPDGNPVAANERTQDARSACARTLVIEGPQQGLWRLTPVPGGPFQLRVTAVSDFMLETAEFVEPGGPLTHFASFKIAGQPVVGRPATLSVTATGPPMQSYEFALISEQGRVIEQVTLEERGEQQWEGTVNVPAEAFRVAVSGKDQSGTPYQRWSKAPFRPELVEVRAVSRTAILQAGSESQVSFAVRNAGPDAASFGIVASDDRRLVTRVEPVLLDLAPGAEQQVSVWLKVPPGTIAETADVVTVTASTLGSRPRSNSGAMSVGFRE